MSRRFLALVLLPALLAGCATKRDLRDLRAEVGSLRDSQNAQLQEIRRQTEMILDSLNLQGTRMRGDLSNQLVQLERQLIQLQELTGQSQQRLADLRQELREREEAIRNAAAATAAADAPSPSGAAAPVGAGDRDELFDTSLAALERGSLATARAGFEEFVRAFPADERAAEAQLHLGATYNPASEAEGALEAYARVLELFPDSPQAATALLRAAEIEIERNNDNRARSMLNQITAAYPDSPEADDARELLQELRR